MSPIKQNCKSTSQLAGKADLGESGAAGMGMRAEPRTGRTWREQQPNSPEGRAELGQHQPCPRDGAVKFLQCLFLMPFYTLYNKYYIFYTIYYIL